MLDVALARTLADDELADGYLRPDYDGFCFSRVPATAASFVGGGVGDGLPERATEGVAVDADRVVVVFLDAFGFQQFRRVYDDVELLRSFVDAGRVTPLTSTYPSETAACVTTMHTATDPLEHGMLGWNGYDPTADTVYETLPYAAKDGGELSVAPGALFDADPVYGRLGDQGVDAHVVEPDYGPGYGDASLVGASEHLYTDTGEFASKLVDAVETSTAPSYTYGYYPVVDTVSHRHGPDSEQHDAEVASVCDDLAAAFAAMDDEVAEETVVCLVADHGQVPVENPTELGETGVLEYVPTDRSGTPLVLGGPRNVHLRVTDETAARECLADLDALVVSKDTALAEGLWGQGEPGPAFERNCGDLLVIPNEGALWHAGEPEELALAGMHGGLDPQEALVPFGVARASDLV